MDFKLKEIKGEVNFIMPAGSDFVASTMPFGQAIGICNAGKVEESDKFPDYPICVNGKYYFAGRFKADEPKREEKAMDEPKREDKNFKKDKWKK